MDAEVLFELLIRLSFVVIFLVVLRIAIRRPNRSNVGIALFFGALALALTIDWGVAILGIEAPPRFDAVPRTLLIALPYLLLHIVAEFSDVPVRLLRAAALGFALGVVAIITWTDLPTAAVVFLVAYFVTFQVYAAMKFLWESTRAPGVTRRRMQAAATGTALLSLGVLLAGVEAAWGAPDGWADAPLQAAILGAGVSYLVGFAPPTFFRRAWQEPELRAFLRRVAELPWLEDIGVIVEQLEAGAAASFGAERASIALWDPKRDRLQVAEGESDAPGSEVRPGELIAGRAFQEGRAIYTDDAGRDDPANAGVYEEWGAHAILSAPIVAGDRRLGVLSVYDRRASLFAADDLGLVQLLADQVAIVLESRRLLQEAAEVRAREEATRLKDDFLSAAAHDLRTPLTSIIGSAQILERRAVARSAEAGELAGLHRISREAKRLGDLVARLLDVGRAEKGQLVAEEREPVELTELAREVCERQTAELHQCSVEADGPVTAEVDPLRVEQLLENLVENGKKYSPDGGEITVEVWNEPGPDGRKARIAVRDRGIGIPPADHSLVFERFQRAANVDDRRFSGMGLGLYICRVIAEQHDGRIWLESRVGEGSTFHVALPLAVQPPWGEERE